MSEYSEYFIFLTESKFKAKLSESKIEDFLEEKYFNEPVSHYLSVDFGASTGLLSLNFDLSSSSEERLLKELEKQNDIQYKKDPNHFWWIYDILRNSSAENYFYFDGKNFKSVEFKEFDKILNKMIKSKLNPYITYGEWEPQNEDE